MKIRLADRWDIPEIIEMLREYRGQTPWSRLALCDNEPYIRELLSHILAGMGQIFIAERNEEVVGMLLAIKNSNIWDPDLYVINEMAFWVRPEHRGTTAGYRLLTAYRDYCEQERSAGRIEAYTLSKMTTSPDLDYGRFGFEKLEETWRT
jgi:GNAT superfamily N-acetyltransferase